MPIWVDILVTVAGVVGTLLGILGITSYFQTRMQFKAQKKNKDEEKQEALKQEDYLRQLKDIINQEISPVIDNLKEIKDDVVLVKKGTQATCRNDLEEMYAKAEKDGYCSSDDKMKFEATYQVYHLLGKNGVMDAKRDHLLKMPETKSVKCIRKKAKVSEKEGE